MKKYQLIVMSFDGEYQKEFHDFESKEAAWKYADDMGSRWYFYPFYFLTTESGKTIADASYEFQNLIGERVKYVQACFKAASEKPENQDADAETYHFRVCWI
jgi:hypothetical protein